MKMQPIQLTIQPSNVVHCLGIDPGCELQGFAAWNRQTQQFDQVCSLPAALLIKTILISYPPGSTIIRIDAGWLLKKVWHGEPAKASSWPIQSRLGNACNTGVRVGINQGFGKMLMQLLRFEGYQVTEIPPGKTGWGEWDADAAKRMTGWPGVTNDHNRDAMRLSFKR